MKINSDVNILGGLSDFEIIYGLLRAENREKSAGHATKIKTEKSVRRFEKSIKNTLLAFDNEKQKVIVKNILLNEGITNDSRLILFWNASRNNDLLNYLNLNVFFPAYYSGRIVIRQEDAADCLNELKITEKELGKWSAKTVKTTASKYLTLLKKFNLLEGSVNKSIKHPFLDDKMFVLFIYWVLAIENKANILQSSWLKYAFSEERFFIERIFQKRFSKFIEVNYTGDKLQVHPVIEYKDIYDVCAHS